MTRLEGRAGLSWWRKLGDEGCIQGASGKVLEGWLASIE